MTAVPDYVPMLIKGKGATPKDGGCLVQIANWLEDSDTWTDEPLCVHPVIAYWAVYANDMADNEHRHRLALLAPRLAGTKIADPVVEDTITLLLRRYVEDNPLPKIRVAGGLVWKKKGDGVAEGVIDVNTIVAADQDQLYPWLEGILDYYDFLTGRNSRELLSEQEWLEIKELVGQ